MSLSLSEAFQYCVKMAKHSVEIFCCVLASTILVKKLLNENVLAYFRLLHYLFILYSSLFNCQSQWRSERGFGGSTPPHCEKMYIFTA